MILPSCPHCGSKVARRLGVAEKIAMFVPLPMFWKASYECDGCGRRFRARGGLGAPMLNVGFAAAAIMLGEYWYIWAAFLILWTLPAIFARREQYGFLEVVLSGAILGMLWGAVLVFARVDGRELLRGGALDGLWAALVVMSGVGYALLAHLVDMLTMGPLREMKAPEPR